jgi:beta-glucosidase-like glycosyl hydrolase
MVLGGVKGLSSGYAEKDAAELLDSYARAGIKAFLFPGSYLFDPETLARLALRARNAVRDSGLGSALIAVGGDAEPAFGLPPSPASITPLGIASSGSKAAAKRAGALMGSILASCGVDMVLSPRLDLASDPKDPIGALEGFGEDSRAAGSLGSSYIRGLSREGILSCIGRFPGLGATCRDCYEGMPFIALPVERLERCEMRPFAQVVSGGVAAVLVGRVLVPSLESERIPASASARVIEGRLRESMGFRGLVVGDDIGPAEEPGAAALLGALAGCDLCLFSRPEQALAAAAALDKAAAGGELPAVRVEMSRRRFERLLGSRRRASLSRSPAWRAAKLLRARRDIERSVTLLRGSLTLSAAEAGEYSSVVALVFSPPPQASDAREADRVAARIKAGLPGVEVICLPADPKPADIAKLSRLLAEDGRFKEAVIFTYDAHFRPAQEGVARLVEEALPIFRVVAMRDPYDAAFFPRAIGLAAAYGFSEASAGAVASVLAGKLKARGGHPVEVIGLEV